MKWTSLTHRICSALDRSATDWPILAGLFRRYLEEHHKGVLGKAGELELRNPGVAPIIKWVGGKRQLLSEIRKEIPRDYKVYYEPFVGGGAVLFALQPTRAVINDINPELINVYTVIRDQVDELIEDLKKHKNKAPYFYKMREKDRDAQEYQKLSAVKRASRLLYLNKTCYNGLFRVNRAGEFNVPFGRYKNPDLVNATGLRAVRDYFQGAEVVLRCTDFAQALEGIDDKDFVYFDPPYDPVSSSANFTGYDKGGFDREEQLRLKALCDQLNERGVRFLLSNSSTDFILALYKDYNIRIVQAKRAINSRADRRGNVDEVLVKNYS